MMHRCTEVFAKEFRRVLIRQFDFDWSLCSSDMTAHDLKGSAKHQEDKIEIYTWQIERFKQSESEISSENNRLSSWTAISTLIVDKFLT